MNTPKAVLSIPHVIKQVPGGERAYDIFSRILERCPFPILVSSGEGMRTKKIRADIGEYKKLLGIGETK